MVLMHSDHAGIGCHGSDDLTVGLARQADHRIDLVGDAEPDDSARRIVDAFVERFPARASAAGH